MTCKKERESLCVYSGESFSKRGSEGETDQHGVSCTTTEDECFKSDIEPSVHRWKENQSQLLPSTQVLHPNNSTTRGKTPFEGAWGWKQPP
jgi:hypothetical protein